MYTERWRKRFLALAHHISTWSKDPSTCVGAIIVNNEKVIVGTGYNGFPRKVADYQYRYENRQEKLQMIIHAEMNAILNASASVKDCSLFTYPIPPCSRCATMVIQAGISAIYYPNLPSNHPLQEVKARWMEDFILAEKMYREANVGLFLIEMDGKL